MSSFYVCLRIEKITVVLFVCMSILLNVALEVSFVFVNILMPNVNRCDCTLTPCSTRPSKFGGCTQLLVFHIPNSKGLHFVRRQQFPPSLSNTVCCSTKSEFHRAVQCTLLYCGQFLQDFQGTWSWCI